MLGRSYAALAIVAAVCALVTAPGAGAGADRSALIFTLQEIRSAAATYDPQVLLPTKVPPGVAFADLAGICNPPGTGGPRCRHFIEYVTRRIDGRSAFQLFVYDGRVSSGVVAALMRHDGTVNGSTSKFTAGTFAGTRERQWNHSFKIGGVDTYVWQAGAKTYALSVRFLDNGKQAYPGTNPTSIIASFASVRGAKPLPPPVRVTVPDVIGLDYMQAVQALSKAGLKVQGVKVTAPTPDVRGLIIATSPQAGASLSRGTTVTVTLAV